MAFAKRVIGDNSSLALNRQRGTFLPGARRSRERRIMKMIDLTGQRFGRLTVVRHAGKSAHGSIMWKCQSDCGKRKTIAGSSLRRGLTRSCGCLFSERLVAFNRSPEHRFRAAEGNRRRALPAPGFCERE